MRTRSIRSEASLNRFSCLSNIQQTSIGVLCRIYVEALLIYWILLFSSVRCFNIFFFFLSCITFKITQDEFSELTGLIAYHGESFLDFDSRLVDGLVAFPYGPAYRYVTHHAVDGVCGAVANGWEFQSHPSKVTRIIGMDNECRLTLHADGAWVGRPGAGGVPAAGPDPLPTARAAESHAVHGHAASSAMRTFFAFLSSCRRASGTPPSLPRSGASATSLAAFAREAARPTSAFCGRL